MCLWVCECRTPRKPQEGVCSSGSGVTGGYWTSGCGCWEWNGCSVRTPGSLYHPAISSVLLFPLLFCNVLGRHSWPRLTWNSPCNPGWLKLGVILLSCSALFCFIFASAFQLLTFQALLSSPPERVCLFHTVYYKFNNACLVHSSYRQNIFLL